MYVSLQCKGKQITNTMNTIEERLREAIEETKRGIRNEFDSLYLREPNKRAEELIQSCREMRLNDLADEMESDYKFELNRIV